MKFRIVVIAAAKSALREIFRYVELKILLNARTS